jgi:cytochrome c-type protein NapC
MGRLTERLRRWAAARRSLVVLGTGIGAGLGAMALMGTTLVYTSSENFCAASCHEMATNPAIEYRATVHDRNRTGVRAACPDCHVPHAPIPLYVRKMGAVNDLWGHLVTHSIDTREKFEARRQLLAERVWVYMKGNDSRECRHCHDVAKMDPEKQSVQAKARHDKARRDKLTCVDCHFAIAHHEPLGGPGPQELDVDRSLIPRGAVF